jgi:apolipoprotein N-acyltransferase
VISPKEWSSEVDASLDRLRELTLEASSEGSELIVWSESAIPASFDASVEMRNYVLSTVKKAGAPILFGTVSYKRSENRPGEARSLNRAYLIEPNGTLAGSYDKIHLMPFGEYVPYQKFFFWTGKMVREVGDFVPGERPVLFSVGDLSVAPLICYESVFPQLVRRFIREGGSLIVNITNDGWFGGAAGPHMHLAFSVFRAVENRRYLVRCANTGVSAVVDPYGRIKVKLDENVSGHISHVVRGEERLTFYAKYGDLLPYFSIAVVLLAALFILPLKLPVWRLRSL